MVLADVQKFFEGGISAEKSGCKFGGYGSFLPTQERTPSILLQDKPAIGVVSDAYCRSKKSSNEGLVEKIRRKATGSSVQASNFKGGSSSSVLMHGSRGRGAGPVNEKSTINDSSCLERRDQNANLPKVVLLRTKMGSNTTERKKNTTIYSDFRLSQSSASEDDDLDEDQDSDEYSSPDRTPLTMIRIITSHHVPDGRLLSPSTDLVTEPFAKKQRPWSTNLDGLKEKVRSPPFPKKVDTKHDLGLVKDEGHVFEKMDTSREKTRKHASIWKGDRSISSDRMLKRAKVEKEKGGSKESSRHTSKPLSKGSAKDLQKSVERVAERQARDAVSEPGT